MEASPSENNRSDEATSSRAPQNLLDGPRELNILNRRLQILVLDEEIPYPLNSGKRIRTWNLLLNLCHKHDLTFLCYGTPEDPGIPIMQESGIRVVIVPKLCPSGSTEFYLGAFANIFSTWPYSVSRHHTRRYAHTIQKLVKQYRFDLVHCEWTPYVSYLRSIGQLPAVIMAHNIETTVWKRRAQYAANPAESFFMKIQALKMEFFEKKYFSRSGKVVTVSEEEKQTARQWGAHSVWLVSNGVDTQSLRPSLEPPQPNSLLFLGSLDWQPNRDALLYLLREIFPRIRLANSRAVLNIVGRQPATKLKEQVQGIAGINWVGEVPDIRPYFASAAVVLVPLRIGGGSRIKILESLSMGKAVVTTHIGAEGLDVVSGTHCLIADTPSEYADCVIELLNSRERAAELGRNGRELVVRQYDWSQLAHILERVWIETAATVSQR